MAFAACVQRVPFRDVLLSVWALQRLNVTKVGCHSSLKAFTSQSFA